MCVFSCLDVRRMMGDISKLQKLHPDINVFRIRFTLLIGFFTTGSEICCEN